MFDIDEVKITDKMGVILKEIRMEKGFSRELIAERAGIGTRHLAAIENEKRAPSIEVFCRIIRAVGISSDCVVYPEYKNSESEEMQLIRLGFVKSAPMPDRSLFLRQLQIRHIVISHKDIVHAVFVDSRFQFFHAGISSVFSICCSSVLFTLF